jgi:hypothetical protein
MKNRVFHNFSFHELNNVLCLSALLIVINSCSIFNQLSKSDADGDGIADERDLCQETPAGVAVDKKGCPKDSDSDGIADFKDDCPDKPGNTAFNGCPDTDSDGIPDKDDLCPQEPGLFKYKGCPDTDKDGVPDNMDNCPESPNGCIVNSEGCPTDTDADGVMDCEDDCPNISGSTGNNGCPSVFTEMVFEPIPVPSRHYVIDKSVFSSCSNFSGVNKIFVKALKENGYNEFSYFNTKGPNGDAEGFVLVSPLEQIMFNGQSVSEETRWPLTEPTGLSSGFSIDNFFGIMNNENPGYYRCFVFIVTKNILEFDESENLMVENLSSFTDSDILFLSDQFLRTRINPSKYNYVTLVYHFQKNELTKESELLIPGHLNGLSHLKSSGLWKSMKMK